MNLCAIYITTTAFQRVQYQLIDIVLEVSGRHSVGPRQVVLCEKGSVFSVVQDHVVGQR